MHIGNSSPLNPRPGRSGERSGIDLTRENREGIQKAVDRAVDDMQRATQEATAAKEATASDAASRATESASRAAGRGEDTIELSSGAERLAADELPGPGGTRENADARAQRVAELKAAFERGDLHSPERLARAAERLLMSDDV